MRGPLVMEVNPSVPTRTVSKFIAYAKANPGKINMASGGNGTPMHVAGELFKMMAGVDMVHVPYFNPFPDLLSRQVHVHFGPISSSLGYIRSGKMRALAIAGAARSQMLPDLPTVSEFVRGYEATNWYAVGAPRATPAAAIETLNAAINAALTDPAFASRLADIGVEPMPMTAAACSAFLADETGQMDQGGQVREPQAALT